MSLRIILKGYYGFGNLGDDVLMKVAYDWLRTNFSFAEIVICTDSPDPSYINLLIGSPVRIIKSDEPVTADFILHGGGGQYFDFKTGDWKFRALNSVIIFLGPAFYRKIYRLYRKVKRTSGVTGKIRMGIGIGIGSYTPSSRRFYADVLELSGFAFLRVRDSESLIGLRKYNKKCDAKVSSDIAFLTPLQPGAEKKQSQQPIIGFVLRDWPYDDNRHLTSIAEVADNLLNQGYSVRFYSFDQHADTEYIKRFSKKYPFVVWNPSQMSIDEFMGNMEECTLIISSRAHGAILAVYKNLPVIVLEIEPKLTHIHLLLKRSTTLVEIPIDRTGMISTIRATVSQIKGLRIIAREEYASNHKQIKQAFEELREFMNLRIRI
jgi:polysaccharide pyruvyl transferase WcaK-like protein